MRKKSVVVDTNAVNATETPAIPVGNPPPKVNAPAVPKSWTKSKWVGSREGLKPTSSQIGAASGAATEMQSSTTWVADFGSNAPDPKVLAANLTTASSWRDSWSIAVAWAAYCSEQRRLWEDAAFSMVSELKPLFDYASAKDPTIAKRYPSTKLVVDARSVSAQRGATTRKNQKKKATKAQAAVPDLPATAAGSAAH